MPFVKGQSGNPKGGPRKPEIALVREAIEATGREKKKSLWKHLIEQCYVDNAVLIAVSKKFMPDLTEDQGLKEAIRTFLIRPESK